MEKFIEKLSLDRVQLDESLFNTISDIQNKDSIKKSVHDDKDKWKRRIKDNIDIEAHIRAKWMCQKHQYIDNVTTLRCHIKG